MATFTLTNLTGKDLSIDNVFIARGGTKVVGALTPAMMSAKTNGQIGITASNNSKIDFSASTLDNSLLSSYIDVNGLLANNGTTFTTGELRANFATIANKVQQLENFIMNQLEP